MKFMGHIKVHKAHEVEFTHKSKKCS